MSVCPSVCLSVCTNAYYIHIFHPNWTADIFLESLHQGRGFKAMLHRFIIEFAINFELKNFQFYDLKIPFHPSIHLRTLTTSKFLMLSKEEVYFLKLCTKLNLFASQKYQNWDRNLECSNSFNFPAGVCLSVCTKK